MGKDKKKTSNKGAKVDPPVADPNKHDKGVMPGKEWTNGQSDTQRDRRYEDDETTTVNKEVV